MAYYKKHVFVCANQKAQGKKCCAEGGGEAAFAYMKNKLSEQDMNGPGKIRVSKTGCLGRCSSGPCIVVYPEGVWYTYGNTENIDKIIEDHLIHDHIVDSLLID